MDGPHRPSAYHPGLEKHETRATRHLQASQSRVRQVTSDRRRTADSGRVAEKPGRALRAEEVRFKGTILAYTAAY